VGCDIEGRVEICLDLKARRLFCRAGRMAAIRVVEGMLE
jgi:hypothetical protein